MEIKSLNVGRHKRIPWWQIDFGDEARTAIMRAIDARSFSMGSVIHELEECVSELLKTKHCIAVTNGTSALLITLIALGIRPGDEVVIQDRTWIAAANAANILGASIKLADVEHPPMFTPDSTEPPLFSVDQVENLISSQTRAIIVSHMNGRVPSLSDLDRLKNLGIPIIEDSAQALGSQDSSGRYLGTIFNAGCFSLAMTKLISAGQGGFVITNDDDLARQMRLARTQGVEQVFDANWAVQGLNFRMTDLHASIALSQIKNMSDIFKRQNEVIDCYSKNLQNSPEISLVRRGKGMIEMGPYIECVAKNRKLLLESLNANGVEARPFYPNLASAKHLNPLGYETPNSELWGNHGLYLPSGPGISDRDIRLVCEMINSYSSTGIIDSTTIL